MSSEDKMEETFAKLLPHLKEWLRQTLVDEVEELRDSEHLNEAVAFGTIAFILAGTSAFSWYALMLGKGCCEFEVAARLALDLALSQDGEMAIKEDLKDLQLFATAIKDRV